MNKRKRYSDTKPTFSDAFLLLTKADEISEEHTALLFDKLTYSIFGIALMPQNKMSILMLDRLANLYLQVKDIKETWRFPDDIEQIINEVYCSTKQLFPLKIGIKKAGRLLREELSNNPFRNGIQLGTIEKLMNLTHTTYIKEDLPYYSRLGLGHHANRVVNEEQQLLSDAFYLLALAEDEYEMMLKYKESLTRPKSEEHFNYLTEMNANVCSLCRNSVIGFYAFFEAFINGLGLNYLYHNYNSLCSEDRFALEGKDRQGNHYLKIEMKLECLQRIIAKKVTFTTNNPQQLKDQTFITLFQKMKDKRDVAMHYSKIKGEIMFSPQEWLDEAFDTSELIIIASRKIWKACYTVDHYPYYLRELNYNYLFEKAKDRIKTKREDKLTWYPLP